MDKLNLTIEQIEELLQSRPSMFNCALLLDIEELYKRNEWLRKRNNELVEILEEFYQFWNNRPIEDSLRGAMKADDERLYNAAKKAGVGYYGCDTADHMADVILSLRASLDEWKADAERLAELVEAQRNAYDLMGCDGVTGITDEGYKKLERALIAHTALVEKEKNNE